MSILEKAIGLLQEMPEQKLEAVYLYICFVSSQVDDKEANTDQDSKIKKHMIQSSVKKKQKAFQSLMSFAGTLPEDFDYKRELEEAREEKYARFI